MDILAALTVIASVTVFGTLGFFLRDIQVQPKLDELKKLKRANLEEKGYIVWGHSNDKRAYHIKSFDGGRSWFSINSDGTVKGRTDKRLLEAIDNEEAAKILGYLGN